MRILWIDDEIDYLRPHIYELKNRGYIVDTATNGMDGLKLLDEFDYDIVLIDQYMPGLDGISTLKGIRERDDYIAVAIVTKAEDLKLIEEAYTKFADDFVIKPFTPSQLLSVLKRLVEKRNLISERIYHDYLSDIRNKPFPETPQAWIDYYKMLVKWRIRLKKYGENEFMELEEDFRANLMRAYSDFIIRNYETWLKKNELIFSYNIMEHFVFPTIRKKEKAVFFLLDCMRYDQYLAISQILREYFSMKTEMYYSILPTATHFSRNAIFAGLSPLKIATNYPHLWSWQENNQNRGEKELLRQALIRNNINVDMKFAKIIYPSRSKKTIEILHKNFPQFQVIILNLFDILIHAIKEESLIKEFAVDESSIIDLTTTWIKNSFLLPLMEEYAHRGYTIFITTDHGFIRVKRPAIVKGGKTISQNLRYKYGPSLTIDKKGAWLIDNPERIELPVPGPFRFGIARDDFFFVYPTKPRLYTNQYRDTFQHGGITPEEMIIPMGIYFPKN